VIHGDFKGKNVLLNIIKESNMHDHLSSYSLFVLQVKLIDFGESEFRSVDGGGEFTKKRDSLPSMAPEIFKDDGESYTFSADVYNFALVFCKVLTGNISFASEVRSKHLEIIQSGKRPPLPYQGDYCPAFLSRFIKR